MYFSNQVLSTPAENLALEEAWLDMAEDGLWDVEILRLWQPESTFVVIGRGSRIAEEVNLIETSAANIPVLRRASGGAAIVAGPGCLMYAVLLSYQRRPHLRSLDQAHLEVMQTLLAGLAPHCPALRWHGTCDLVIPDFSPAIHDGGRPEADTQRTTDMGLSFRKVSGNSLRCRRDWLLYHGTLLLSMDLSLIDRFLLHPPREPEYRQNRRHADFVANLNLAPETLIESLMRAWQAEQAYGPPLPRQRIDKLVNERYASQAWNRQR